MSNVTREPRFLLHGAMEAKIELKVKGVISYVSNSVVGFHHETTEFFLVFAIEKNPTECNNIVSQLFPIEIQLT
jgi:hypothetical protein